MSAKPARKPKSIVSGIGSGDPGAEATRLVALCRAPAYLAMKRAQAALALLQKIDPLPVDLTCPGMSQEDLGEWARSLTEEAIRDGPPATSTRS